MPPIDYGRAAELTANLEDRLVDSLIVCEAVSTSAVVFSVWTR